MPDSDTAPDGRLSQIIGHSPRTLAALLGLTSEPMPPDAPLATRAPDALAVPQALSLVVASAAADRAAAAHIFERYRARLSTATRRRQDADLALFAAYLDSVGIAVTLNPATDPQAWSGVSWGLVEGFVAWQLQQGYAIGSINVRLSTVKSYAQHAARAGALAPEAYALIKTVKGFRHKEGRRVDAKREVTRKGHKKADPVSISRAQAAQLKAQPDPRDTLLMALLLDHGLRVGEVAALTPAAFDLDRRLVTFYRSKVDKTQRHRLSDATRAAAEQLLGDTPPDAPLFGSVRTIRRRVAAAGVAVGLIGLSPHDARHYWATAATRAGTQIKALQDAGGWSSPAMPLRYAESAEVANDGVQLD